MSRLRSDYDRQILRLAVPALGSLAAEPLYVLVDTAIVGHLGRSPLAALGIAATVLTGLFAIFNFLQYGTTAQVARACGAGQVRAAKQLGAQSGWLSIGFGLVVAVGVATLADPVAALVGGRGATAELAVGYLRIAAIGLPAAFVAIGAQGFLRGVADLRTPVLIVIAGNAVNLVLEVVFVYGLGWGVRGSAWGTAVAQLGMGVAFLVAIGRHLGRVDAMPRLGLALRLLAVGCWIFLRTVSLIGRSAHSTWRRR